MEGGVFVHDIYMKNPLFLRIVRQRIMYEVGKVNLVLIALNSNKNSSSFGAES
jgi:hypothetical protein